MIKSFSCHPQVMLSKLLIPLGIPFMAPTFCLSRMDAHVDSMTSLAVVSFDLSFRDSLENSVPPISTTSCARVPVSYAFSSKPLHVSIVLRFMYRFSTFSMKKPNWAEVSTLPNRSNAFTRCSSETDRAIVMSSTSLPIFSLSIIR